MAKTKLYTFYTSPCTNKACGHNGVPAGYMDTLFELKAHEASENWASLPNIFTKEGLLQLPG